MLFFQKREGVLGEDEYVGPYYINGAFVTALNLFLIFVAIANIGMMMFGMVQFVCSHMLITALIYLVPVIFLLAIQKKHTRKANMTMYLTSTIITLLTPAICGLFYILPALFFISTADEIYRGAPFAFVGVVVAALLFFGGAVLTFFINTLLKNGTSCFIVSLIYLILALLLLYGIMKIDNITPAKALSIYSLW